VVAPLVDTVDDHAVPAADGERPSAACEAVGTANADVVLPTINDATAAITDAVPASNDAQPAKRTRQSVRKAGERDPRLPPAGAWIEREHNGKQVRVMVLHDGLLCNGKQYRSLSGLARELTGTNHNGLVFFGVVPRPVAKKKGRAAE
jgi:hypothetical protein